VRLTVAAHWLTDSTCNNSGENSMGDWPFADLRNLASTSVRRIIPDDDPVLLVSHDADDGGWQFLTGGPFEAADPTEELYFAVRAGDRRQYSSSSPLIFL
jgi:hypothetical protein